MGMQKRFSEIICSGGGGEEGRGKRERDSGLEILLKPDSSYEIRLALCGGALYLI